MAWKFDKALFMKANADKETRLCFQRLIECLLRRDLRAIQTEFSMMTNEQKVLVGLCVGKDGNTLTHRICSGVVGESSELYLDAMLPGDPLMILGAPNKHGLFPIHIATINMLENIIDYLVDHGANVNQRCLVDGNTAAIFASGVNDFDLLTKLVESNADITIKNKAGLTCQDYILKNTDEETAKKWSILSTIQAATQSGLLVEKNDGGKRSARAL